MRYSLVSVTNKYEQELGTRNSYNSNFWSKYTGIIFCSCKMFPNFFVIKTRDPDPESMDPDPKEWIIGPIRLLEIKKFVRSIEPRIFREKNRVW